MSLGSLKQVHLWRSGIQEPDGADFVRLGADGTIEVPENPVVAFIQGDGIGPEITPAMILVVQHAVERAYGGRRRPVWVEVLAGSRAEEQTGERLPPETLDFLKKSIVGIKGPLGTPVGRGGRSVNAMLRQSLDFYSATRPICWLGQPTPLPDPQRLDCTVFRENSDDVYVGIEYFAGRQDTHRVSRFLREEMGVAPASLPDDCGITVKPMSEFKTKRHVRKGLRYALAHGRRRVALVGKGNILKATEGAFIEWGQEVAGEPEFRERVSLEDQPADERIRLSTVITDQMLMQLVLSPQAYDVIITQNLNGDYISDLASALVGGPGYVPSGNFGDGYALFESTHGTAYCIAGTNTANPVSLILSGGMLLEYLGWGEAAELLRTATSATIRSGRGTPDIAAAFERSDVRATSLSTWEFAQQIANRI